MAITCVSFRPFINDLHPDAAVFRRASAGPRPAKPGEPGCHGPVRRGYASPPRLLGGYSPARPTARGAGAALRLRSAHGFPGPERSASRRGTDVPHISQAGDTHPQPTEGAGWKPAVRSRPRRPSPPRRTAGILPALPGDPVRRGYVSPAQLLGGYVPATSLDPSDRRAGAGRMSRGNSRLGRHLPSQRARPPGSANGPG